MKEPINNQIKDIMFYLNQHLNGVELEQGTSSSNTNEIPNGDVSQSESTNRPLCHIKNKIELSM